MQRFLFRKVFAPMLAAAALAVPAATASPATQPPPDIAKVPTAVGTGGAAATVDTLATAAASNRPRVNDSA